MGKGHHVKGHTRGGKHVKGYHRGDGDGPALAADPSLGPLWGVDPGKVKALDKRIKFARKHPKRSASIDRALGRRSTGGIRRASR